LGCLQAPCNAGKPSELKTNASFAKASVIERFNVLEDYRGGLLLMKIAENVFSKRFLLVSACVSILVLPISAYNLALSSGNSKNQADDGVDNSLNFVFTWGPGAQRIVNGTFRLEIMFRLERRVGSPANHLCMVINANDDEYNKYDYLGLVFDTNQNGYIDLEDKSYGMCVDNKTTESHLLSGGFLGWSWRLPIRGPHIVLFEPDTGYTFIINFPYQGYGDWDPGSVLKKGQDNPLHVCFYDFDAEGFLMPGVYVRFLFRIPESWSF